MSKYKAMISDIDGTLTVVDPYAIPSDKVIETIKQATNQGKIFSLATGRPFFLVEHLIEQLGLTSPTISDNGTVITDSKTKEVLYEATLERDEALTIMELCRQFPFFRVNTNIITKDNRNPTSIAENARVRKISIHDITHAEADDFTKELETRFKDITVVKASSYKSAEHIDLYITSAHGTKQHAVLKYAEILGITTEEIIGIGDGYNDFPLLMACGLKVAMGNAVDDLKAIADYVAPSVEADGLATVIEKYLL